jgi:hypothetical protein
MVNLSRFALSWSASREQTSVVVSRCLALPIWSSAGSICAIEDQYSSRYGRQSSSVERLYRPVIVKVGGSSSCLVSFQLRCHIVSHSQCRRSSPGSQNNGRPYRGQVHWSHQPIVKKPGGQSVEKSVVVMVTSRESVLVMVISLSSQWSWSVENKVEVSASHSQNMVIIVVTGVSSVGSQNNRWSSVRA